MTPDAAETLALRALVFIADDEKRLQFFVNASGLSATDLRSEAGNPAFLSGVLDHLLADEALLIAFCEAEEIEPTVPARARMALPGFSPDP
jgi:hypothetical protein